MRVSVFLFLCIFLSVNTRAQNSPKPAYTLTPRFHYGYIWNFSEKVAHLSNQHMPGFELNITKQTKGNKEWQREFNYPQVGYSLYYFAFDPKKPVGNALAMLIHAGKKICSSKRTELQWRLGFGLAYVERRYDVYNNFRNNVISERLNFTLNGQLNFNYKISPKILFNMGIGLMHISNGALKRPNFGINLPTIHAGIGLNIVKGEDEYRKDSLKSFKRKTYIHATVFTGLKEVYPVNSPKYFLTGTNAYIERRMNRKSGLNIGIDLSYDHSKKAEIKNDTLNVANTFGNRSQIGLIAGHELYIHRLSLLTQMGVYLHDPTHLNKAIYQKVGFKYYLSDKIFVSMIMKVHFGIADWIEWGGGIRL
jgi:hypothetical protein